MKNLVIVFALLLALVCCTTEADRNRMRAGLDSINQRNRNDQSFTVADVEPYVQFFDDHGTPNDRLLAYYLLGRTYHNHGEAPMALECYQKAADCADTLSADCNYVIDELDRSLHPTLVRTLVSRIVNDKNMKGQLIFTTHDAGLLDGKVFRNDEIWFAEKDRETQSTHLYTLDEFKPRADLDLEKGYLNGRFGAIPFLARFNELNWE